MHPHRLTISKFLNSLIVVIITFWAATAVSHAQALKKLTDNQGRSIEVRILHVTDTSVLVEMADGREFDIPLKNLSWPDQDYLEAWTPNHKTPDNPIDSVVIIKAGESSGSGFFAYDRGKTYLYTNQHVISDTLNVRALDSRGNYIDLGALEVSNTQDMARYRVDVDEALPISDAIRADEVLKVLGNSEGAGVITSANAVVKGVGPFEVEVDTDFVPGNSGGPAINKDGEVVGMATYVRTAKENPDEITEDTRYAEARRFTLRPSRINDWKQVDPAEYSKQYKLLEEAEYKLYQGLWTFQVLTKGQNQYTQIPGDWDREITDILKNHNRRQQRPNSTTTYYQDGYYLIPQRRSHQGSKNASRRTNLRALERYLQKQKDSFYRLNNAQLSIDYFKLNKYNGSQLLEQRIDMVLRDISNETR